MTKERRINEGNNTTESSTLTLKRVAIIIERNLGVGQVGNVAAILMGQAVLLCPEIYNPSAPLDTQGNRHAAIKYSTVVLKGGEGQIISLAQQLQDQHPPLFYAVFSKLGQGLHNAYTEYQNSVMSKSFEQLGAAGIVIVGDDEKVRLVTKKFSLLQ